MGQVGRFLCVGFDRHSSSTQVDGFILDTAETVAQATAMLRAQSYDGVIVAVRAAYDGGAEWIEGLLAAMPYLNVVVVMNETRVAQSVEARLRQAGAKFMLSEDTSHVEDWIHSLIMA